MTGVQRYAKEIINAFDSIATVGEIALVLPKGDWHVPNYTKIRVVEVSPLKGILWEQVTFPLYVMMKRGACLNLCNVAPLLTPGYSTIHDLKILSNPNFFGLKFRTWYKLLFANQTRRCKAIFTVSEQVKKDLIKYYPSLLPQNVIVAPDAWQHYERIDYDNKALSKYGVVRGQYFFAMGSLEPNKNFRWIAELAKRNPKEMFVVAGSLNPKVFKEGLGFDLPQNMRLLGYVSDEEAKTLMKDAKAFLFPSFTEGFGMPPLEALSAGVPRIIVSDIPVMHEIFRNNAIYINPSHYDYDLTKLLSNSLCDAEDVLKRFSWVESAKIIISVLRNRG